MASPGNPCQYVYEFSIMSSGYGQLAVIKNAMNNNFVCQLAICQYMNIDFKSMHFMTAESDMLILYGLLLTHVCTITLYSIYQISGVAFLKI